MSSTRTSKTAGETRTDDGAPSGQVEPVIAVNGTEPNTDAPSTSTVENTADDVPKMSDLTGIRYVGKADKRTLTSKDLESLGIENPKEDLEWSSVNDKLVTTEHFNAATRDALLGLPTKEFVAE